jgi:uncharacterized lipoprotein YddW (UPF0748 family)
MKLNTVCYTLFLLFTNINLINAQTIYPKREFRGAWVSTVYNVDYPSSTSLSSTAQQNEFITQIDNLKLAGCNAVFIQIRPSCDAFYASTFEPWSQWLEGTQNQAPSPYYDPLSFYIKECKKRGMELHGWINPYRAASNYTTQSISSNHITVTQPSWCVTYGTKKLLNPGLAVVREYVTKIVMDVVRRYDIDGIHFDDYFYPYPDGTLPPFDDANSFATEPRGFTNLANWRRDNVNIFIDKVHDSIKSVKPWVRFGVGPFGIWKNGVPAGITGLSSYNDIYCDPIQWLQNNNVDYVLPQLYWVIGGSQDFNTLVNWWGTQASTYGRNCFAGLASYRLDPANGNWNNSEITNQINSTRILNANVPGICFFSSKSIQNNTKQIRDTLRINQNKYLSILPALTWENATPPLTISGLNNVVTASTVNLTWAVPGIAADGDSAHYFVVYRFPQGTTIDLTNPRYIIGRTAKDTNSYLDNISLAIGESVTYTITSLDRYHNESTGVSQTVCNGCDTTNPTTAIAVVGTWHTQDFTANFNDLDNIDGSGIEKGYYNVETWNGVEWRSNATQGFLYDSFGTTSVNTDWNTTTSNGTWTSDANALIQSDQTISNTNLWTRLNQNLSNRYVYDFTAKMDGTGSNRRIGIHLFADDSLASERGNSILVVFRLDNQNIQLYRTTNNVLGSSLHTEPYAFDANTLYNFKIIYDRTTGLIKVYVNSVLCVNYTFTSFITTGKYVSFRSGNAHVEVNDIRVLRSRNSATVITVGALSTNAITSQNINPATPAGRINSITNDNFYNISSVSEKLINVDYTVPLLALTINDGPLLDVDTVINGNSVAGNYGAAIDPNSGVMSYNYAIGSSVGGNDILNWTNSSVLNFSESGLNLLPNLHYYISLKATNGAGLNSDTISSDGFIYLSQNNGLKQVNNSVATWTIFPNPFQSYININGNYVGKLNVKLLDASGRILQEKSIHNHVTETLISLQDIEGTAGIYFLEIQTETESVLIKLVKTE